MNGEYCGRCVRWSEYSHNQLYFWSVDIDFSFFTCCMLLVSHCNVHMWQCLQSWSAAGILPTLTATPDQTEDKNLPSHSSQCQTYSQLESEIKTLSVVCTPSPAPRPSYHFSCNPELRWGVRPSPIRNKKCSNVIIMFPGPEYLYLEPAGQSVKVWVTCHQRTLPANIKHCNPLLISHQLSLVPPDGWLTVSGDRRPWYSRGGNWWDNSKSDSFLFMFLSCIISIERDQYRVFKQQKVQTIQLWRLNSRE